MTSILRDEQQLALQTILESLEATVEQLEHAEEVPERQSVRAELVKMADRRRVLCEGLKQALRDLGDRPTTTDPERQTLVLSWRRFSAWLANGPSVAEYLKYFISADQELESTIKAQRTSAPETSEDLLNELSGQLQRDGAIFERLMDSALSDD